ncbi:DUF5320 domain-containing protein [Patescibacteria group bacterium]|nr:DUF5320 domain-containing protein [Patescibacteria group bacterium]
MPKYDGTGPQGSGPDTGWGKGPCGGGMARGQTFGKRGFRSMCGWFGFSNRPYSKSDDLSGTKVYIDNLKEELKGAEEYLKELEAKK